MRTNKKLEILRVELDVQKQKLANVVAEKSVGGWYSSDEGLKLANRRLTLRLQKADWELRKERDGNAEESRSARRRRVRTRVRVGASLSAATIAP